MKIPKIPHQKFIKLNWKETSINNIPITTDITPTLLVEKPTTESHQIILSKGRYINIFKEVLGKIWNHRIPPNPNFPYPQEDRTSGGERS